MAARSEGVGSRGQLRAGLALVPRGEFSVVIATLGATVAAQLAPVSAAYGLILAVVGPILARYSDSISDALERFQEKRALANATAVAIPEGDE